MNTVVYQKKKSVLIIGQAPPEKNYEIPFSRTRLYKWLSDIGITRDDALLIFEFEALVKNFPGKSNKGHRIPTEIEIEKDIPHLINIINKNAFRIIVPMGKLAIQYALNIKPDLKKIVGKEFYIPLFSNKTKTTLVIPLPHPSGLSTWAFKGQNKKRLNTALHLIKKNLIS